MDECYLDLPYFRDIKEDENKFRENEFGIYKYGPFSRPIQCRITKMM